jgi:hypothetical protein
MLSIDDVLLEAWQIRLLPYKTCQHVFHKYCTDVRAETGTKSIPGVLLGEEMKQLVEFGHAR